MKSLFCAILLAGALLCHPNFIAHAEAPGDRQLTAQQVENDILLAKSAYARIHPGYTRYTSAKELEDAWQAIIARANADGGMALSDLYLEIEAVLALIHCDHTKAELPKVMKADRNEVPVYLPLLWEWVEDKGIVTFAPPGSKIAPGDELLSIDGRPLGEMAATVLPYIPYDGQTVWSAETGLAASLEFMGGGIDHFGALLWDVKPNAELVLQAANMEPRTVSVGRITHEVWTSLRTSEARAANFKDAVTFERVGKNAGYLRIDTFVNYRDPIKPDKLYAPIFKTMKTEQRGTLILDLRQNGGGSSDAQMRLLSHLIKEPLVPMRNICAKTIDFDGLREHLWTWDKRALKPNPIGFKETPDGEYCLRKMVDSDLKKKKPARNAFKGELLILTSNANSSASTSLIALLKTHRGAILIGERTGGSPDGPTAGLLFTLTLPESGIQTRVPFLRYFNNVTGVSEGKGIEPDTLAPNTVRGIREGIDPAYEAALIYTLKGVVD